ncbi:MAG TPA: hypothetical protein VL157_09550 [Gemmatimonadaceae bacterium]|jgi:hypothetical protein|nr:hypothetical protein [Gemmatimonadaceae bacterium]
MSSLAPAITHDAGYPARVRIEPATEPRNRLTTAFRFLLAIPHLIIVGGTAAAAFSWEWQDHARSGLGAGGVGVLVWSTRVEAYRLLLRDEYPPFFLDATIPSDGPID